MSQSSASITPRSSKAPTVPPYAWVILTVAFIASVAAPLNQNKVSPLMPALMDAFQITLSSAGLMMSVFAVTGFILALPAGIILQRVGPKVSATIAMACLVLGSALGAITLSYPIMLASRVIEGAGLGLIAVIAPAVIAMWFPPEKQGAPMGIWATWVPVGTMIILLVGPAMSAAWGWQSIWWLGAGVALLALVLVWFFLRTPPSPPEDAAAVEQVPPLRQALANRNIWLLALAFACFNMALVSLMTYYPTYLATERGFSMASASLALSTVMFVVLIASPIVGILLDKLGARKPVMLVAFVVVMVMMLFPFNISGGMITVWMILLGLVGGSLPVACFSAVPEIMRKPQLAGIGMAVLMVGQNVGQLVGAPLFGALAESAGWATAGYGMIPALVVGLAASWLIKIR